MCPEVSSFFLEEEVSRWLGMELEAINLMLCTHSAKKKLNALHTKKIDNFFHTC